MRRGVKFYDSRMSRVAVPAMERTLKVPLRGLTTAGGDSLNSAKERLKARRNAMEKCHEEVICTSCHHCAVTTPPHPVPPQASLYGRCVSLKANLKQNDCQTEFNALLACMKRHTR